MIAAGLGWEVVDLIFGTQEQQRTRGLVMSEGDWGAPDCGGLNVTVDKDVAAVKEYYKRPIEGTGSFYWDVTEGERAACHWMAR